MRGKATPEWTARVAAQLEKLIHEGDILELEGAIGLDHLLEFEWGVDP